MFQDGSIMSFFYSERVDSYSETVTMVILEQSEKRDTISWNDTE